MKFSSAFWFGYFYNMVIALSFATVAVAAVALPIVLAIKRNHVGCAMFSIPVFRLHERAFNLSELQTGSRKGKSKTYKILNGFLKS